MMRVTRLSGPGAAQLVCLGCHRRLFKLGLTEDDACPGCGGTAFLAVSTSKRFVLWRPTAAPVAG